MSFHLNPHFSAGDLPDPSDLGEIIRKADIVVPEFPADDTATQLLRKIAMGDRASFDHARLGYLTPSKVRRWSEAFFSGLYASRTTTSTIDIEYASPIRSVFNTTTELLLPYHTIDARAEDRPGARPLVLATLAAVRERDQMILENLKPRIEQAIAGNKRLEAKRDKAPLRVEVFYGSAHRSLLDAVLAKNAQEPTTGFDATITDDSIENDTQELIYGHYLRGQDISDDEIQTDLAFVTMYEHLHIDRAIPLELSGRAFFAMFLEHTKDLDLSDFKAAYQELKSRILSS